MFDFKNSSWDDAKKEYDRIAKEIGDDQFMTKKELKSLPEVLQHGEQVLAFTSGIMDGNTWLIALTDRRIIFLDKGMFFGLKQAVIQLDKVNSISGKTGMIFGEIIITDGSVSRTIKNVWKKTVNAFTSKTLEALDGLQRKNTNTEKKEAEGDGVSRLEKLIEMHSKNLLSDEEFRAAKAKLLNM